MLRGLLDQVQSRAGKATPTPATVQPAGPDVDQPAAASARTKAPRLRRLNGEAPAPQRSSVADLLVADFERSVAAQATGRKKLPGHAEDAFQLKLRPRAHGEGSFAAVAGSPPRSHYDAKPERRSPSPRRSGGGSAPSPGASPPRSAQRQRTLLVPPNGPPQRDGDPTRPALDILAWFDESPKALVRPLGVL